jgi:WD40 repeat protein
VSLWNLADPSHRAPFATLTGPTNSITSVAFSPGGTSLAAACQDGKAWLWNVADLAHPAPLGQPLTAPADSLTALAFSPDGRTLAAGGAGGVIQL